MNTKTEFVESTVSIKRPIIKYMTLIVGISVAVVVAFLLSSCTTESNSQNVVALSQEEMIKRGKYLTVIGACNDCHSPKVMTAAGVIPDTSRLLSGHPQNEPLGTPIITNEWILFGQGFTSAIGPWGVSFSANLTPDDTGVGNWSFEQFKTAIQKGKYKGLEGSRDLLPPMPWQMYQNFSEEDLRCIFTYLQSLKPISNLVPAPISIEELNAMKNKVVIQ